MVENLHSQLSQSTNLTSSFSLVSVLTYLASLYTNLVRAYCEKSSTINLAEKITRTASKTYLGTPLGLFNLDLSDNKELCNNGHEISQFTLLMSEAMYTLQL